MGDGGERLHDWMFLGQTGREATGAIIMGRRTFDFGVVPWGYPPTFHAPSFVLSADAREEIVKEGGTTYTFVTDGIESALEQARAAAGGKNITVIGGANAAQQYIRAGLLDEMQIHLVPVLLGDGVRLFDHHGAGQVELERAEVIGAPGVTHLRFRAVKETSS